MKPKAEYYVQVQRHRTLKYRAKQHHQDYITIPTELSKSLELDAGQIMRCTLNGNGKSITYTKVAGKPIEEKMTYEEWLARIGPHIPTGPPGKNPFDIYREAGINKESVPAIWLERAKREIVLHSHLSAESHRILWYVTRKEASQMPRKMVDQKLTQLIST
jgi:hypothetical protein